MNPDTQTVVIEDCVQVDRALTPIDIVADESDFDIGATDIHTGIDRIHVQSRRIVHNSDGKGWGRTQRFNELPV